VLYLALVLVTTVVGGVLSAQYNTSGPSVLEDCVLAQNKNLSPSLNPSSPVGLDCIHSLVSKCEFNIVSEAEVNAP
jgi:hypothetical protein